MTYQELFYLKYKKGVTTQELIKRYPEAVDRVHKVALCDVPEETLKEVLDEEDEFLSLMKLKQKFLKLFPRK